MSDPGILTYCSSNTRILPIEDSEDSSLSITKPHLQLPRVIPHKRRTFIEPTSPLSGKPPIFGHILSPARSRLVKNDESPSSFRSISAHSRGMRRPPMHKYWTTVNLCEAKLFDLNIHTGIEARFRGETGFLLFGDGLQHHLAVLASIAPVSLKSAFKDAVVRLRDALGKIRHRGSAIVYQPLLNGSPRYPDTHRKQAIDFLRTAGAKSLIEVWYETSDGFGYMGLDNKMTFKIYIKDQPTSCNAKDVATLQNQGLEHAEHTGSEPLSNGSPRSLHSKSQTSHTHIPFEFSDVHSLLHSGWVNLRNGHAQVADFKKDKGIQSLYEASVGVALFGDSRSRKAILASLAPTDEETADEIEALAYEHVLRDFAIVYYPGNKREDTRPITRRLRRMGAKVGGMAYDVGASPGYLGIDREFMIKVRRDCGDFDLHLERIRKTVGGGTTSRSLTPLSRRSFSSNSTTTDSLRSPVSPFRSKSEYSGLVQHGVFSFPETPTVSPERNRTPSMFGPRYRDKLTAITRRNWIQVHPGSAGFADFRNKDKGIEAKGFLGGTGVLVVSTRERKAFLAHVSLKSLEAAHDLGVRAKLYSGSETAVLYLAIGKDGKPFAPNLKDVERVLRNIGIKEVQRCVYAMWKPEKTYFGIDENFDVTVNGYEEEHTTHPSRSFPRIVPGGHRSKWNS